MVIFFVSNILLIVVCALLSSLVNLVLHELGHAISMLMMTDGKVSIYLGSYGDSRHCFKLSLGRLNIYLKYNPLLWVRGICKPPQERFSINKLILYVAAGPLVSLTLTIICSSVLYHYDFSLPSKLILTFLTCFGLFFSLSSIIPGNSSNYSREGRQQDNDAMQIVRLLRHRRSANKYREAVECVGERTQTTLSRESTQR